MKQIILKSSGLIFILFALSINSVFAQIPTSGLVGLWKFCNNAADSSGNGNHGTVDGATPYDSRFSEANGAYYFDGIDDYIYCSPDSMGITDKVTVSAWIQNSTGSYPTIVSKYDFTAGIEKGYNLRLQSIGDPVMEGRDGNGVFISSGTGNFGLYDDYWHHLVGIVDHDVWSIWVDGVLISSYDSNHNNVDLTTPSVMTFGRLATYTGASWRFFTGAIDDIAIYNRALDSTEIQQLYQDSTLCSYTAIGELDRENDLKVYPNPVSDLLTIDVQGQEFDLRIIDHLGRTIVDKRHLMNSHQINMSGHIAGMYFVELILENRRVYRKIILE